MDRLIMMLFSHAENTKICTIQKIPAIAMVIVYLQNQVVANIADRAELIKRLEKAESQVINCIYIM